MINPRQPVRVLVVDDCRLARDMISAILSSDPEINIVGQASDGLEAVAMARTLCPGIITMDIEMPSLDGLSAIERIMADKPVPILVVTALTGVRNAFAAVSRGALDVVEKPDIDMANGLKLIKKVKMLAGVDIMAHLRASGRVQEGLAPKISWELPSLRSPVKNLVAIACSVGGPSALQNILSRLPEEFPIPILISQHMADGFTGELAEWLNGSTPLKVSVAKTGDIPEPGCVYVNPSEFSLGLTSRGIILLRQETGRQIYRPSCDAMLLSVAEVHGARAVGLIMTGMGGDGVAGMKALKAAGGVTLAQDKDSSVIYGMNAMAVSQGCIDKVLPLSEIPGELIKLVAKRIA